MAPTTPLLQHSNSMTYRLGIIGAGRPWKTEGATGFGMSHRHIQGFLKTGKCSLAAVCDIIPENAQVFADQYGGADVFDDYRVMLGTVNPDIVSISTWPHLHSPMVIACAEAKVKGVFCEKPMATTWGDAKAMHEACVAGGVPLAFNHQRRFNGPFQKAKDLLNNGAIGKLLRLEGQCDNIYDWGTHWLDMFFFYNDETPAQWVIGQIDCSTEKRIFGAPVEDQSICHFKFENEVRATLVCGFEAETGCANRLIGEKGTIEIGWQEPWLRIRSEGDPYWRGVETGEGIHDHAAINRATADFVDAVESGRRPLLSSYNAIQATEVIFACYESSRRRGRVDLPLTVEDSALISMLEEGIIGPSAAD